MTAPGSYCIYLLDLDSQLDILDLGRTMKEINPSAQYVYISQDETKARAAIKNKANYFLVKPIDKQELIQALIEMRQIIQQDSIVIKISTGERRLRISQLNYINIVKRCLCYHLTDGNVFDGQTLRSSFEKAVSPLHMQKSFLFLSPSTLINIDGIKIVNSDNIVFENDDVLYFPKKQYQVVHDAWKNYNRFVN